jgi:hypothetical protein
MKKLTLETISDFWRKIEETSEEKVIEIDLTRYYFISHSALISLSSLIEFYLCDDEKKILIILPKISDEFANNSDRLIPLKNKNKNYISNFLKQNIIFMTADDFFTNILKLRFMSFLQHSGFFDIWADVFANNRVSFINFQKDLTQSIFSYSGKKTESDDLEESQSPDYEYARYSPVKRIVGNTRLENKQVLKNVVLDLFSKLPDDQKKSRLFNDNEFENIFLEQLSDNVASHAAQSSAYVIVRSFSKDDIQKHQHTEYLLPEFDNHTKKRCSLFGFFEINISDSGDGIDGTLYEAYEHVIKNIFNKTIHFENEDVIAFSLDEFGSRYLLKDDKYKSLIDEHSLNTILKYTIKYGGHIRILSNNHCINYDTSKFLKRGSWGLGFRGEKIKGSFYQKGSNIRIILPHTSSFNTNYPKSRSLKWSPELPEEVKSLHAKYIGVELPNRPHVLIPT